MKFLILFLATFLPLTLVNAEDSPKAFTYYYTEFGIETYFALTTENIETRAMNRGTLSEEETEQISKMMMALPLTVSDRFSQKRVRLLLKGPQSGENPLTIFVDNEGIVLKDAETRILSEADFRILKELLKKHISPTAK